MSIFIFLFNWETSGPTIITFLQMGCYSWSWLIVFFCDCEAVAYLHYIPLFCCLNPLLWKLFQCLETYSNFLWPTWLYMRCNCFFRSVFLLSRFSGNSGKQYAKHTTIRFFHWSPQFNKHAISTVPCLCSGRCESAVRSRSCSR